MPALAVWAFAFLAAVLVLLAIDWSYHRHRWLVRSIAPSTTILLFGAIVLFGTGQGRDLGHGLLEAGPRQIAWLLAALLFWGFATWHNARFPLDRAHAAWLVARGQNAKPIPGDRRRRWFPRLLGLAVFVFALLHIGLAWWWGGDLGPALVLAALVLLAAALYAFVVIFRRQAGRRVEAKIASRAPKAAAGLERAFTDRAGQAGETRLTVAPAAATMLAYAVFFVIALLLAVWAWLAPLAQGQALGSMAVGFFAFGGLLTGLVLLWTLAERVRRPLPALVGGLLVLALVVSLVRHYHPVRTCSEDDPCGAVTALDDQRPSVAEAARDWYAQASEGWPRDRPLPMIMVATAGGGLRAAYWTAVVLGALPRELELDLAAFERHLFAISGVSGGSVGAAFRTALRGHHDTAEALDAAVRLALADDFLAPALASLAFVDLPSWLLPELGQPTRGVVLEQTFEAAAPDLAAPFLASRPDGRWRPLLLLNATHQETGRRVIASHVRIDRQDFLDAFDLHRLIEADIRLSTAAHNSARFTYVSPAGRLATPDDEGRGWVIDGGYFENFGALTALELAGAALAVLEEEVGDGPPVLPVLLQISSDPALGGAVDAPARDRADLGEFPGCIGVGAASEAAVPSALPFDPDSDRQPLLAGNQLLAPLRGVLGSRSAHGIVAAKQLARFACDRRRAGQRAAFAHFAMCDPVDPPLGWVMSSGSRSAIESLWLNPCNAGARDAMVEAFTGLDGTPN